MKTTIQLIVWLLCGASALAQGTFVVVPGGLANTEGNSSMTEPFNSPSFRMQMVFDASEFAFLGGGTGRIDEIAFRIDGAATGGAGYFFAGSTIQLSTTQRGPDSLSPIFAENIGSDVTTIWNGAFGVSGLHTGGSTEPFNRALGPTFFQYSPSMGNLLLDLRGRSGQVIFPGGLDAQGVAGDSVSRVFANSELLSEGTLDTLGLVTRFSVSIIPEPDITIQIALGASIFLLFAARRCR